jgi:hypothetical protein
MTWHEYRPVKTLMESKALLLRDATPLNTKGPRKGKHALHLADASMQVLQTHPSVWMLYRRAIGAGLPSEFQRFRRPPASPTAADRAWQVIERLARTLVGVSDTPITLRTAVMKVVEADPSLYDRYAAASRHASSGGAADARRFASDRTAVAARPGPCARPRRRP